MRPAPNAQTVCPNDSAYCILYDADCGICSRAVLWLQRQSIREPVRWLPVGSDEARLLLPNRPPEEMAVVGPRGEVWTGINGAIVSLDLAQCSKLAAWMNLPIINSMARVGYRLIARHRSWLSRWLGLRACNV